MPVPGYDPDDVDESLEANLGDEGIERRLTDRQLEAYCAGDADLVDLLDDEEIRRVLGGEDAPADARD